jgi:hypothetical protein
MKVLRVDRHGVTEVEADEQDILSPEITWDTLTFDGAHDIWCDDEGLFVPEAFMASIGKHRRVPLPAYLIGVSGERAVVTSMSADELQFMVKEIRPVG